MISAYLYRVKKLKFSFCYEFYKKQIKLDSIGSLRRKSKIYTDEKFPSSREFMKR